jgi:hypothetical protein
MSEEIKGTKNLVEVVDLGLGILDVAVQAKKNDGKYGPEDLALVLQLLPLVSPAVADISEVPAELADLSAEEAADLVAHIMAKFAVDDAKAKAILEKSLKAAYAVYALVKEVA